MVRISVVLASVFLAFSAAGKPGLYDSAAVNVVEIQFAQPDWDYQLDTAKVGADGYIMAQWVKINGVQFDSAGVKYKGNSSYDSTYAKNPIHIALDEFTSNAYQGFTDIKLGNGYADPSLIREVLSYDILQHYMDCPRANFAQLIINGDYIGLYSNVESVNKDFCSDHFYSSQNTFIKCNPLLNPGPATKSNLKYIPSADSSAYFNFYEMKSDAGWNDLVALCDTVTNFQGSMHSNFDVDKVLWMLAFNNVLVNLDSYTGVFSQNYYLYRDDGGQYNPVVWDLNMSLGGFPFVGNLNSSMGSLTIGNMQQLSPLIHATDPYWPLINDVLINVQDKNKYIAHMRTIADEMFASGYYTAHAAQLQTMIDAAVLLDTNSFFSYAQFQSAMTTDVSFGSYTVPGIDNLMSARLTYLQGTPEFSAAPPVITQVIPSDSFPSINDVITINAVVTNETNVYLGFRSDRTSDFTLGVMFDDGLHDDGNAGDHVYGTGVLISSLTCQYYIYAENTGAGVFSPPRAEFEFYELSAVLPQPLPGQVAINEFLAVNQNGATDETGQHEDWIELFNATTTPLDLYGMYLSDRLDNPMKFAFPQNTIIEPDSVLIIWADEDSSTASFLHANFKLSGNGEAIVLSDLAGNIIDSLTFGPQSIDVSMERCPDGTGSFAFQTQPSFMAKNCPTGLQELEAKISWKATPVPADAYVVLTWQGPAQHYDIFNSHGATVLSGKGQGRTVVDTQSWSPGIYIIRSGSSSRRITILHP